VDEPLPDRLTNDKDGDEIAQLAGRLNGAATRRILERVFTVADRRRVTAEDPQRRHIANIWAELQNISVRRAIIDLAVKSDLISGNHYEYLLSKVDEPPPAGNVPVYPVWDRTKCTLTFRGDLARRVRGLTVAKHIVAILDAFQRLGWPERIDDPLPEHTDKQRLRESIAKLNNGLVGIRFLSDGSGEGVIWKPV
jgi:hypothetical protein